MKESIKNNDNNNGIVKCNINGEEYTFWTHADFIKPYIINYLKARFPGKLIVRELNKVDLSIPENNLPIEVQATPIMKHDNNRYPNYSRFEQIIEKQIKQNINDCSMCYFFFDSELLKSMENAGKKISINMDWFRKYMKGEKLKVFTVSYDGKIEDKKYNDFDFLSKISQTCKVAYETDDMILNRNKMKIYINVVKGYGFKQDEIDKFYDCWKDYCKSNEVDNTHKNDDFMSFILKQKDKRTRLYGKILHSINNLLIINDILALKNYNPSAKSYASILGVFDLEGGSSSNAITRFVDRSNVRQYFPGYLRNKEVWDKLKGHSLNPRQFERIVNNGIGNYFYYEDKGDITIESEQINDKDVNVTIESKDQIISINIKDNTKQKNIEDAWS